MEKLASKVIATYAGHTIATAESLTGGGIGAELTAVPGASSVYMGGIISYTNSAKHALLGVEEELLEKFGAVSGPVAEAMAKGARNALGASVAVSVTGLAGPGGDEYGNPVGTVYIGFADEKRCICRRLHFLGDRQAVRRQTVNAALHLLLDMCPKE